MHGVAHVTLREVVRFGMRLVPLWKVMAARNRRCISTQTPLQRLRHWRKARLYSRVQKRSETSTNISLGRSALRLKELHVKNESIFYILHRKDGRNYGTILISGEIRAIWLCSLRFSTKKSCRRVSTAIEAR
uniref:Uncharacterized protein n=1 Tax=Rhipicephalus zambeziensis TaxID=60191 RepID=A0A224YHX2_9ACAR